MTPEPTVAGHYGRPKIVETIVNSFAQAGKTDLTAADLSVVDQFHVGGNHATGDLAEAMAVRAGMHLLDIGCGLGGPARSFANRGCRVTGIDLTPEFIEAAGHLTRMVGMEDRVGFRQASAASLPFEDGVFDGAYLIHVGMNLPDKSAVFREVRRVLKPGGVFALFDVMRTAEGPIRYPVPWATTEETSFVETPAGYRAALEAAGFRVVSERNRGVWAVEQTERSMARAQQPGNTGPGMALLMGEKTPILIGNILGMMREGLLTPVEMLVSAA